MTTKVKYLTKAGLIFVSLLKTFCLFKRKLMGDEITLAIIVDINSSILKKVLNDVKRVISITKLSIETLKYFKKTPYFFKLLFILITN